MTTIDFTKALQDAKSVSFEALPVGDYDVEIVTADAVQSGTGKPMIKVKMEVLSGPYAKRKVFNNFTLTVDNPNAVSIFFRHMKAFGLNEQFFANLGTTGLEPVASNLMGKRARVKLGHREWGGETRNNVEGIMPYTGAPGAGVPAMVPVPPPVVAAQPPTQAPVPPPSSQPAPAATAPVTPPVAAPTATPVAAPPVPPPPAAPELPI